MMASTTAMRTICEPRELGRRTAQSNRDKRKPGGGLAGFVGLAQLAVTLSAAPIDNFNVVWDSPSRDHHGSMPLGNGDIALNAWMTADGDLHFYIGKTDAWDDNARLLKVGKVRVQFEPNPISSGLAFRQELKLNEGCLEITTGAQAATGSSVAPHRHATIRIWVDAHHPVIHVTADSAGPIEAVASVELWRTNQYESEIQVSDVLLNRARPDQKQAPLIVEPDTVLTRHPSTPERWLADMADTIRRVEAQDFEVRRAAHHRWWNGFWDRSWIRASTRTKVTPTHASVVPANRHPLRIGMDQDGGNRFVGELGRVTVFDQAFPESEVRLLANSDRKPLATQPANGHTWSPSRTRRPAVADYT
jgi:hypothetical protein